ncbi:fungal specific transcription factor [Aspergillus arachidicola]|uniref:Fungal specific transcription factor n=1 Tax=Aspergillus arachidicola TaxID=656916 RepID=A0A2G7FF28_9EURO|nr:fungal specific transcription factor [Aspergillus arachidicola]
MNSRRRNGKPASCEPCRKDKVRCDHRLPVCSRCQKKRRTASCFYHPAPLTHRSKSTNVNGSSSGTGSTYSPPASTSQQDDSDARLLRARPASTPISTLSNTEGPGSQLDDGFNMLVTARSLPTGYLGPTSFVAALEDDHELVSSPSERQSHHDAGTALPSDLPLYWVQRTAEILRCLEDFSTITQLVCEYYRLSKAAVIPSLILNALPAIQTMIDEAQLHKGPLEQVARVLQNTKQLLHVPSTMTGRHFHEFFTGPNLRLEILGLFYAIAGRLSVFGLAHDKFPRQNGMAARERFSRKMLAASDAVLQICKLVAPVNDLTIWMLYEILLLSKVAHGDASSAKWRRLGDLSTHIFELGLHRDSQQSSSVPIFLVESRRRLFAATYQLDKSIATFLGRPPRISLRHSDCRLPLDLDDRSLETDQSEIELALQDLDGDGWNTQGSLHRSTFSRQRFLVATFREEILEVSLESQNQRTAEKLRDISMRCHQTWDSMPKQLHYSPDSRDENMSNTVCMMLIVSYLAYLYNDFLIQRLLVQQDPEAYSALLGVSSTILSTVLDFCAMREDMVDLRPDFMWTNLLYGFPSAAVLIKALQKQARTGRPIPYQGSRSVLIRHLSVFISHLESMSRPGVVNQELFHRASKIFSSIIDEVLEPRVAVTLPGPDLDIMADSETCMIGSDDLDFLDMLEFGDSIDQYMIF